uniref:Uncharacterized protein n=1 Tax=Nannochloropsis gaditana TaxID=72520 RepID=A0A023PJR6_9STRA|nr:hypothetical protein NagaMp0023 [Nannochloropsis gaditana]
MISFGQLFILILLVLFLFGDIRKILNKFIILFFNFKNVYKNFNKTNDKNEKNEK